ncbi:early endosome antigen 1-like [Plasmopara halstedii]|uniref:Early endosome antigen 1-like n=1 Tax=Plasmopara halstedii TaxID=4781 RepID=A0A0P1B090_PLAHL|nr:early endosome antigen 1-like [Plasmopara halstedii]CEG47529.1 early endosome antigen 1-like [Plasmopara halstedii]|eukprot:XP_024583898.1 early endosome antigen 1-like [Plasmopara halstedii]
MASLFGKLPSAAMRNYGHSTALVSTANSNCERTLQWVYDDETSNCMLCNTLFTMITRKHHCRRCGNVICHNCSPHKRRISSTDPFPMRVCNTCYAAVDEHFALLEWSGHSSSEIHSKPDPVIEGRVHVGQLYVKVVEAIGLPSTDSITSDPFVRVMLTGKWSHGQEWGNDLKNTKCTKKKSRTLNPRWHETFVFNVCAPGAELLLEVYNHGQLSQPTKLGEATVPLSQIMDQRRHNKWLDLLLPERLHRAGLNNDTRAGRIHVLLHYKFSRMAELCSYFTAEQDYVYEWPEFQAAQLYSNFWVLLDNLWPYLEVVWQILPTLNWEHPTHSFMCFALCVWLCLSLQWLPVVIHLALIAFVLRNYFELNFHSFAGVTDVKDHSTGANVHIDQDISTSAFRQYNLPSGFHHLMNKMTHVTIDQETKRTLQSVQNNMAWWSNIINNLELMFSWEDTFYTARILFYLIWTVPFMWLTHFIYAIRQSISSLVHQHRLRSSMAQADLNTRPSGVGLTGGLSLSDHPRAMRRTVSNASARAHARVIRKEEAFGAAASAISKRFVVSGEPSLRKRLRFFAPNYYAVFDHFVTGCVLDYCVRCEGAKGQVRGTRALLSSHQAIQVILLLYIVYLIP